VTVHSAVCVLPETQRQAFLLSKVGALRLYSDLSSVSRLDIRSAELLLFRDSNLSLHSYHVTAPYSLPQKKELRK